MDAEQLTDEVREFVNNSTMKPGINEVDAVNMSAEACATVHEEYELLARVLPYAIALGLC